jgi:cobalamin biosynthesis protein CobD/CbiB
MTERSHNKGIPSRNVIDIMDIHSNISKSHKYSKDTKTKRIIGLVLAFISIGIFFFLGYLVAGLPMPILAKTLIFVMIAVLGLIPGYIAAALLH